MLNEEETKFTNTEPKRVKVYILENNEWKDTGTGFCIGEISTAAHPEEPNSNDHEKKTAFLIVSNEEFSSDILLRSKLEGNIEYQRQEETLIVWKDLDGHDIALSFEESLGCDRLCDFIVQVQRHVEKNISLVAVRSTDDGIGSVHEIITGPVSLPSNNEEQNIDTLLEALKILNENTAYEFLKNETVEFVLQSDYIRILISSFEKAEKERNIKDLLLLSNIVKTLILYNQRDILELLVDDDHIMGVVGILEYDTEFPNMKANHREYLKLRAPIFKEILPLQNQDLKTIIKKCFRLQFLKDVVLVRFLDDHNFNLFLDIILDLETCIIDFLEVDPFLESILKLYDITPKEEKEYECIDEKRKHGIKLLHQCVQMSKNLEDRDKTKFYKMLVRKGLFNLLSHAFNVETDPNLRILATDTIITIIEHDILLIHNVSYKKRKTNDVENVSEDLDKQGSNIISDNMKFLMILSKILLQDKSPGLREQIIQALNTLLHPEGCIGSVDGDIDNLHSGAMLGDFNYGFNSDHDDQFDASTSMKNEFGEDDEGKDGDVSFESVTNDQDFQLNEYFSNFYQQVAPILFRPLIAENLDSDLYDDHLLIQLVKLISFICTEHTRLISRKFVLESGILKRISLLITDDHILQLRLTATRCIKNIMCLDDKYYHRYLMSNNLYDSLFELLKENLKKDNLANSCIQDFFGIISKHCNTLGLNNNEFEELRKQTGLKLNKKSNFKLLNKYLITRFGETLLQIAEIPFIRDMLDIYNEETERANNKQGKLLIDNFKSVVVEAVQDDVDIQMDSPRSNLDTNGDNSEIRKRLHSDIETMEDGTDSTKDAHYNKDENVILKKQMEDNSCK